MSDDRRESINKALTAYEESSDKTTLSIDYRGKKHVQQVVTLNTSVPLLNHNNSRLRAQLRTHPQKDLVFASPASSEAQSILAELLRSTDKFQDLKRELSDFGQIDPGIITRDGMLVNGNTRLVACRDLGLEGFITAVLPVDANSEDLFEIESSLQLRKLTHQDYTLTNRLLLVEDLWEKQQDEKLVASSMNWLRGGVKKVHQSRRILELIEEVRSLSDEDFSYQYFDSKEELLKDLDRDYQALLQESPLDAEQLKWTRITAMLVGLNKDEVRAIDDDFVEESLVARVQDDETLTYLNKFAKSPGSSTIADLLEDSEYAPKYDMRLVSKDILQQTVQDGSIENSKLDHFSKLNAAMRLGARNTIETDLQKKILNEPIAYLNEVKLKIEELAGQLPEFVKAPGFDKQKFHFEAKKTLKALGQLQEELNRQLDSN